MALSSRASTSKGVSGVSGIRLRSYSGNVFRFDPGALCLELLVTGGPGALTRYEVLHTPDDLVEWVDQSRLTPTPLALRVTEGDVAYARGLRDALTRTVVSRVVGGGLPELGIAPADTVDLDLVNEAAARPPLAPAIGADGARGWAAGTATGAQLLSTVARDAVDLLTGPYAERIRMCAGDRCYLLYVDTSRPGRRRWCSMEHCGNRHKVRAHRVRRSGAAPVE
ncbi:CGNR zinc finger domain-containing protein [Streptomyces europaeiscabiei]|uniref:CGNR zinc finger domain-containing protein n=1 Tax=Streptomyces europaeiscabiei TaxID=146819 RepID=UPI0029A68974|nr:ABATE domain-containing protein [Streptomyces europaeiscabiei]MDX3580528.1 ABATE domain-containing protein [Streptomyces europaeiscabiei]MDX3615541.1 ABATE domain-containing protein [Streptomyces europaeiscabiei]MDX3631463.1 ABATE domain-containing protein [Streptomyces europaeiscabiei]MDX3647943.1 ABATE domain-containing protein [Streptomyces europaeiscabiei]WUD32612.1 ABATE domain-containing protein [Streptomyces europaeiscabiei]